MMERWLLMAICMQLSFLVLSVDPPGFINIDCGIESKTPYVDKITGLTFVSDDQYINTGTGINYHVANENIKTDEKYTQLNTLRSFPKNNRSCYTMTSVTKESKYFVRASFYYGNYDQLNKPPSFDLYFGVNFWTVVNSQIEFYNIYSYEIVAVAPTDYIQVCLVNNGKGTPFISTLELRPLTTDLYPLAHTKQFLKILDRRNMGTSSSSLIRYPVDPDDRLWFGNSGWFPNSYRAIYTNSSIYCNKMDMPSSLLQTAVVSLTANDSLDILLYFLEMNNHSATLYVGLHFAEIQILNSTDLRSFDIYFNGKNQGPISPNYLSQTYFEKTTEKASDLFNLSLQRSSLSTLPPILNAYEISEIVPVKSLPTDNGDVTAINSIKASYNVDKGNWNGDPCVPPSFRWKGVSCTNDSSVFSRITALDLSSSNLTGQIIDAFGDLTKLQKLNLSDNSLEGKVPDSLDRLTSLTSLDLSLNTKLGGKLPPGLLQRLRNSRLEVIYDNTGIKLDGIKKSPTVLIIAIVVPVGVLLIGGAMTLFLMYKKKHKNTSINPQSSNDQNVYNNVEDERKRSQSSFERRRFSFEELKLITNQFSEQIGVGGFGKVFKGYLENGKEVAVKVHMGLSSQGYRQFLNEVGSLSRIHHKNLVSLIGYCDDRNNIALIYEYMPKGNLQEWLRGNAGPLHWKQRLRIAYESAQGLEYLHKMCDPPLIHRDVKAANILLTTNLEARISDLGLVRALAGTHVSTQVVGTPGYLDIYYASSSQLTEKTDVYSFGVVLLEMITGRSPILEGSQMGQHLTQFVQEMITKGNIESIVDPYIEGQCNMSSVWKIAALALRCTDEPARRPDMTAVVAELKETLELENCSTGTSNMSSADISRSTDNHSRNENPLVGDFPNSDIEMVAHMKSLQVPDSGPSAR